MKTLDERMNALEDRMNKIVDSINYNNKVSNVLRQELAKQIKELEEIIRKNDRKTASGFGFET